MGIEKALFYLFAAILVGATLLVITVRNPVRAALSLVLAFFASAVLWLLLAAEFLAIVLVLVYVGAVMVLFLFVIMMLDINVATIREGFSRILPVGLMVAIGMVIVLGLVVGSDQLFGPERFGEMARFDADYNNTEALGLVLYTTYVYPFELAAVVLLVAIIAAIALTLRRRPDSRRQNIDAQVSVRRADRVRIVSMAAEPHEDVVEPAVDEASATEEKR